MNTVYPSGHSPSYEFYESFWPCAAPPTNPMNPSGHSPSYESYESLWSQLMYARGFDQHPEQPAVCVNCCAEGCRKMTACANGRESAARGPASVLRRLGGGYYCRAHLPLSLSKLSVRETT